ncbi:MAG: VWA domain-containing protein [Deltaproteobacteria bacterium]|nr:VWA domain-containing protein [Deltaproteobacteria bacterium]
MPRLRSLFVPSLATLLATTATVASAAPSTTSSIQVTVPHNPDTYPITHMRLLVDLDGADGFTITNGNGDVQVISGAVPGSTNFAPVGTAADSVALDPPDDPTQLRRYALDISPRSDLAGGLEPDYCTYSTDWTAVLGGPKPQETWTIATTGGANITGACLLSFNHETSSPLEPCDGAAGAESLALDDFPTVVGEAANPAWSSQSCYGDRPAVHAVLVLDKSGSMNSNHLGADPRPKIDVLTDATRDFFAAWHHLRQGVVERPADRIGVVFFDGVPRDPSEVLAWMPDGMHDFDNTWETLQTNAAGFTIPANGMTTIGGALLTAKGLLPAAGSARQVILLMTDGMQTAAPWVETMPGDDVLIDGVAEFSPTDDIRIDVVTTGNGVAIDAEVPELLAARTGGAYLNTDDVPVSLAPGFDTPIDGEAIRIFFLEALENFLQFNTYQMVLGTRLRPGRAGAGTSFVLAGSGQEALVSMLWPAGHRVEVTLTPPQDSGLQAMVHTSDAGQLFLPLTGTWAAQAANGDVAIATAVAGQWTVAVAPTSAPSVHVSVMQDDLSIKAAMAPVRADTRVGETITLHAALTQGGLPLTGLSAPNGSVTVDVVAPAASLGHLVALSSAQANTSPRAPDPPSAANAKMMAMFAQDQLPPLAATQTLTLRDDGTAGDEEADDGIYTARLTAALPGHYDFRFLAERTSGGNFARQSQHSVHVRPVPEPTSPVDFTVKGSSIVGLQTTPVLANGNLLGPGWSSHLFAVVGGLALPLTDRLDGRYVLTLPTPVPAGTAVPVTFIDVPSVISPTTASDPQRLAALVDAHGVMLGKRDEDPEGPGTEPPGGETTPPIAPKGWCRCRTGPERQPWAPMVWLLATMVVLRRRDRSGSRPAG